MPNINKTLRYSIGVYIDRLFTEIVGLTAEAQFSPKETRADFICRAIVKKDVLSFMLYTLYELKGIDDAKFLSLSTKIEEVGKMLYGWRNQCPKFQAPQRDHL